MDNVGYLSLSHAATVERANDVRANNIANANTAGFRSARAVFEELVVDTKTDTPMEKMSYVLDKGTYSDASQGAVTPTGNPLDLALQGSGWFAYEMENGDKAIGRDGSLTTNAQGELITTSGRPVLDAGGAPIALPAESGEITIATDGTISLANGEIVAQVGMFDAPDATAYARKPGGMLAVPDGQWPLVPSVGTVMLQGFSEQSNVNPIIEMTQMIGLQRAYERSMTMADSANKLRASTIERLGRTS